MHSTFPLPSSNTRYAISWPYLERSHVVVLKDGIPWPFSWVSPAEIQVDAGPDGVLPGTKLEIIRVTPDLESYATIPDATLLDADQLNRLRRQLLYLIQERSGGIAGSLGAAINVVTNQINDTASALDQIDAIIAQLTAGLVTLDDLNADVVIAKNDAAAARQAILDEIQATSEAFTALRNRVLGLEVTAPELGARITTETLQRVSEDEALAQSVTEVQAAMESGDEALTAAVASAVLAQTNADNALASSIESVRVALEDADTALGARVDTEVVGRVNADSALAASISTVDARVTSENAALQASITSVDQARVNGDNALAARTTSLESKVDLAAGQTVNALINAEATTRASADAATAETLTTLQSTVGSQGTTLAQVSQQSATNATTLGVVSAQTVLKTVARADGKQAVAGIGLAATVNGDVAQSEVILMGDRFLLTPPGDASGAATPIVVAGTVNGAPTTVFPAGKFGDQSIGARVLVDGSIEARHMRISGGAGASLWVDTNGRDPSSWTWGNHGDLAEFVTIADGRSGITAIRATGGGKSVDGWPMVPVVEGKRYRLSCWMRRSGDCNGILYLRFAHGTAPTTRVGQGWPGGDGVLTSSGTVEGYNGSTAWQRFYWEFVPTSAVKFLSPRVILNWSGTSGWMEAQDIRLEEMIDSSLIVVGGISADRLDTRGIIVRKADGTPILGDGVSLAAQNITPDAGWLNSNVGAVNLIPTGNVAVYASPGSYGAHVHSLSPTDIAALGLVAGDTVTMSGDMWRDAAAAAAGVVAGLYAYAPPWAAAQELGFAETPADQRYRASKTFQIAPEHVTHGIAFTVYHQPSDTNLAGTVGVERFQLERGPVATAYRPGAAPGANRTTDTSQLADGAGLGTKAVWSGVSGAGKPQDNATVGATIGQNLSGQFTQQSWDLVMTSALIRAAHVGVLTAENFSVGAMSNVINGGISSGGRVAITTNRIAVYDASGTLRNIMGYLL